jgi:diguanylate cyclase (GGDEF)-like protein/PAS domain S-box-containing protein
MKCPVILANEPQRLQALFDHGLHQPEVITNLEPVVDIAARMFRMPIAAVNMIGSEQVFFAAAVGAGEMDMRRDVSFCAHAINQNQVMVVPDALLDERFHDNPLVLGEANIRFYAGVRLLSPEGLALGALCIVDHEPHFDFSLEDQIRLQALAQMASDRLELRRIEIAASRTRPNFEEYAAHASTPIVWFTSAKRIIAWNQAAADMFCYGLAEGEGLSLHTLFSSEAAAVLQDKVESILQLHLLDRVASACELTGRHKDGSDFQVNLSLFAWQAAGSLHFEAVLKPVVAPAAVALPGNTQSVHDPLTGLYNRARFYHFVEETLSQPHAAAVFMIDLDGFKDINDTMGGSVGDAVLREIAQRLSRMVPTHGLVARMGGDDFAIVVPGLELPSEATQLAQKLIDGIEQPMQMQGQSVRVIASCGMALSPLHTLEALELVSNADLALFKAKAQGRGRACLFVPELRQAAVSRRQHALELHRAVDEGEFLLFYQPQVNLQNGRITGAEALIRWNHPLRGILPPVTFLPVLESGKLAATVGSWVLDEACGQLAFWRRQGAEHLRMGVNLFGAQFHTGDLVEQVMTALARHGLPANALELEITENIALDEDEVVLKTLRQLKQYGVGIAFDDFGTGYASLSLLKTYPLTRIKIDRTFVNGMLQHKEDESVVCATLDIAHGFDLQSIAEGIETTEQYEYLKSKQCEEGQGYLFGKPMPADQFAALIF